MTHNYWIKKTHLTLILFFLFSINTVSAQIIEWENCDKFLGNISQYSNSSDWTTYWNQVTSENGGKWGSVEGTRDVMNWTNLDLAYNLAKDNDLLFKQHVFVWGSQQPSWIETLTEEEQLAEVEEWIMEYCERYPDTDWIEVVNEPLHAQPKGTGNGNYFFALGGRGDTGYDWIVKSFELAKQYCPNAKLMINEYNLLNSGTNRSDYLRIVQVLKDKGLIDAIGAQSHAFTINNMTSEEMTEALDHLAQAELPIYITELDIDGPTDETQLERYKEVFPAIWEHPSVAGVTLWGYREGTMWREEAYLLNSDGTDRPAFEWLKDYIIPNNSACEGYSPILNANNTTNQLEIYPNPNNQGVLNIQSDKRIERISIRNISGQKVLDYQTSYLTQKTTIDMALAPGLYLVKVEGPSLSEERRLVIK